MKVRVSILFSIVFLVGVRASESSMEVEYGKRLYENPRGVGCGLCHGRNGEGSIIARYVDKGENRIINGNQINNITLESFLEGMDKSSKIMPKYYLTKNEKLAIYYYLDNVARVNNIEKIDSGENLSKGVDEKGKKEPLKTSLIDSIILKFRGDVREE